MLALPPLFWAGNWVVGRAVHGDMPPMLLGLLRWSLALLVMLPFAWPHLKRDWVKLLAQRRDLLLLGLLGTALHNAVTYLGLNFTTAMNGLMLNSFLPVMIVAISWLLYRERLAGRQWLGVLLSLAGVGVIIARGDWRTLQGLSFNPGDLIVVAGMFMWAFYTILVTARSQSLHLLSFLAAIALVGVVAILPLALLEYALGFRARFTPQTLAAVLYVGILPSFAGYVLWNRGVALAGANVAGLFTHLMPVFGALLSWVFLGEVLLGFHLFGFALILGGIALTTRGRAPPEDG
ncbi:MAG: DMT family transporter [Betaproteobacteria bacterium]|nr:DMT family transporter [Betaproteobacteria bacterium]